MSSRQAGASNHGYHAMRDRARPLDRAAAVRKEDWHLPRHYVGPPVPRCNLCSYKQPVDEPAALVHHFHYSGKLTKEISLNSTTNEYFCPSCMKVHQDYLATDRIKVLLTSSILHQYWAPPESDKMTKQYSGDLLHIDHIGIPGATIDTLTQAFRVDYDREKRGMDVAIVAYYNDYIRGRTTEDIMSCYRGLYKVLQYQAKEHHPDKPNTLAIATLPYAPQLCWLPDDGPYPHPSYQNYLAELTKLNDEIIEYNAKIGAVNPPKLHTYGERTCSVKFKNRYGQEMTRQTRKHRFGQWREEDFSRKLHLDNKRRMDMASTVGNYFVHNTARE